MIKDKKILTQGSKTINKDLNGCVESLSVKKWYKDGVLHRDNDLPAIEFANGNKEWYQNGNLHRDNDLPAIEWFDGSKEWYNKGKKNRLDGPAVVCVDYELFFINDIELEKETFDALPRNKDNKIHSEKPIVLTNKCQEKIVRVFDSVVLEEESFNKKILEEKIKKTIKTKEIKMKNEHIRKNN